MPLLLTVERVHTPEDTVRYMTECTLATIDRLVMLKNKSKSELQRQINIAQLGIDMIKDFDPITCTVPRVDKIIAEYGASVQAYVERD